MDADANPFEPRPEGVDGPKKEQFSSLLTVNQASDYLVFHNLPRSKKTIRKWCRLKHVDKSENTIPGGPKWLITRKSLDAKIAEERLIDASLKQETGTNRSEPVRTQTVANQSEPVRTDELIVVLKNQLSHERKMLSTAEAKNETLLKMYHEISMVAGQAGIELGRGMAEQGRARQLESADKERSAEMRPMANVASPAVDISTRPADNSGELSQEETEDGDNPDDDILEQAVQ